MLDHEACRQKLLIVLHLVPWALTQTHDENCIGDDEDDQVFEQMVSMSSVAVASDRLIVTFMGTPPNCATGYRGDTVSQIMLLMEKMIMIIDVVRSLFSQNFSKRGGTFLHIYQTPKDGPEILILDFWANSSSV